MINVNGIMNNICLMIMSINGINVMWQDNVCNNININNIKANIIIMKIM